MFSLVEFVLDFPREVTFRRFTTFDVDVVVVVIGIGVNLGAASCKNVSPGYCYFDVVPNIGFGVDLSITSLV